MHSESIHETLYILVFNIKYLNHEILVDVIIAPDEVCSECLSIYLCTICFFAFCFFGYISEIFKKTQNVIVCRTHRVPHGPITD